MTFSPESGLRHAMKFCSRILLAVYDHLVFHVGLVWFGLICLTWTLVAVGLYPLLPRDIGRRIGRIGIMSGFRLFLATLELSGRFRFDLAELDALREEDALILAPNHPSLWDVVLIVSRLPKMACIMKADIVNNLFLGAGARLARYIRNDSLRQMIQLAVRDLQQGSQLLLFPEGTRTVRQPVGEFKGSIGVIANRSRVPVQTIFIETNSAFLTKGWPVHKMPSLPMTYRIRLGRRFDPPDNSTAFVAELQQYFMQELGASPAAPAAQAPAAVPEALGIE
jgi:1-acyl-sn-glycerol-3-phosphate acyltransferase